MLDPSRSRSRSLYLFAALACLAGLLPFVVHARGRHTARQGAPNVVGVWRAELTLTRPFRCTFASAMDAQVAASANPWPRAIGRLELHVDSLGESGNYRAPYAGRAALDLGPLRLGRGWCWSTSRFPTPDGRDPATMVLGDLLPGDSVELTLHPFVSHGSIVLRGRLHADSVVGTWRLHSDGPGAEGEFLLRRVAAR